jgi:hypothetical protein
MKKEISRRGKLKYRHGLRPMRKLININIKHHQKNLIFLVVAV